MNAALLIHTCTIERSVASTNTMGEEVRAAYAPIASNVPCRGTLLRGDEAYKRAQGVVIEALVHFDYGQDVKEADRIVNLTTEDGTVLIVQGDVELVNHDPGGRMDHVEAELKAVRTA